MNFLYDIGDMNFGITVVSEEPLEVKDILSALIQTLRARGLSILEQDGNLMITKSKEINQIPTLITPEKKDKNSDKAPIITRVFRIQNVSPTSLMAIIRPMMSQGAMLDVSMETRQLIVTDVATNVEQIATLLQSLDSSHSPLEIEVYKARHMPSETLMIMSRRLIDPFVGTNQLIMVSQNETNSVFIVSTPDIIERAVTLMEDLDVKPKESRVSTADRVYLYKIANQAAPELLKAIKEIISELESTGSQSVRLIAALKTGKWIKESNSLVFVTDAETQTKIEDILKTLDTLSDERNYFIYKIEKAGREQIEKSLEQLAKTLKKTSSDRDLADSITSMRYIKETNSLIFTGTEDALKKLKELLPVFDLAAAQYSPSSHYWLYTPQFLSGKELQDSIASLKKNLAASGLSDEALITAIDSMKWVPATNTVLFTGNPSVLENIQALIRLVDVPASSQGKIFIYRPEFISYEQIEKALDELADKLDHKNFSDRNLASVIDNLTWVPDSQVFLFKGDAASIDKIQAYLKEIDSAKEADTIANAYFLYTLKYASGDDVIRHLEKLAKNFPSKDPHQRAIRKVIDDLSYLKETNALLVTGTQRAVEEVKALIGQFDVQGAAPAYEKTQFFIYKPLHITPQELEEALKETAADLKRSGLIDPSLLHSIETMRLVDLTHSLIFTGTKESLEKTKEIISTIDVVGAGEGGLGEFAGHTFFIYKVRYLPIPDLLRLINNVVHNLEREDKTHNEPLIKGLRTVKEIKETHSLIFTGAPLVLQKISELMKQLDSPGGLGEDMPRQAGSYVIYKPANVNGPELIDMLDELKQNLSQAGVRDQALFDAIDNLKYIERTGYILISGDQKSVDKIQELLKRFDLAGMGEGVTSLSQIGTSFLIYKLHYHLGDTIQETIKGIGKDLGVSDPHANKGLLNAINSLQWIKVTNSLLATGSPEVLAQLKELIMGVDVPLRQVFIEVLILQTTILNNQQFGLQWGSKFQYLNRFAGSTSSFPSPNPLSSNQGFNSALSQGLGAVNGTVTPEPAFIGAPAVGAGGFDLGVIGDIILHKGKSFISLASLVNALQQDNDSVVVMNPKIIAQDNMQSTIFVGQNIPFAGSTVQTIQAGSVGQQTATNIEYRDVGVNLMITPILGTNDIVTLDISNEITTQVNNTTGGVNGVTGLQTARTSLTARVHVPNKHFVALSGMLQDQKTHFKTAIPCLGGLPIIGAFFSENDRSDSRNNLIFFIRPVIIESVEDYKKITDNQEQLYKELGVKQIVKEEIDDGIDWVKTPEDE